MRIDVLDHGYVELIETWGTEERIIESARMSTGGGFVSWDPYPDHPRGDAGLLSYLYKNKHVTPFEMVGMVIQVKAPIFIFREWHRHRTQSYNEMSARYIPLPNEHYLPSRERIINGAQAAASRQAQGQVPLDESRLDAWLDELASVYQEAEIVYQRGLSFGVPKEIARVPVPVARYSVMRASANLRNWLAFLALRMAPTAQWEIRQYAIVVGDMIAGKFPRTWALFESEHNYGPTSK